MISTLLIRRIIANSYIKESTVLPQIQSLDFEGGDGKRGERTAGKGKRVRTRDGRKGIT